MMRVCEASDDVIEGVSYMSRCSSVNASLHPVQAIAVHHQQVPSLRSLLKPMMRLSALLASLFLLATALAAPQTNQEQYEGVREARPCPNDLSNHF
jgi:hypothetical protein